ncbi:MarR family transcriptional regulator [Pseudonocardia sp. KRD291]|uniref:MarR family winged helix-turn-helix transcriptional regulator n=1 Tax=Pseudonocardia sp. KRD291 TaxID=2792007 RepID=UPI001C49E100|nr:MarR family transcriptional regulator [Pseudonocardia sp. KRD291]MBW0103866.1 MarR family transcriptional regulator [Pseudonocardia sp. KRD291]
MRETDDTARQINEELARRHSTATVLFHHAVAERLGLGPADHKCLDLLLERGTMTGSELAAATGLTTGAITGVVARLERDGRIRREPHPDDGRKQVLRPVPEGLRDLQDVFAGIGAETGPLLDGFDDRELRAIAEYLRRSTDFARRHAALLRVATITAGASGTPTNGEADDQH